MKTTRIIMATAVATLALSSAFAQTGTSTGAATSPSSTSTMQASDPKVLSDPAMSSKLSNDLTGRNSTLGTNPVSWYDAGNGYYGTYTSDNTDYMTFYDKQGNFQQTYSKGDWNDANVPSDLKSAYDKSQYKDQEVSGYWTSTDPDQKGYYMELKGKNGKTSRVYADEKGNFSKSASRRGSSNGGSSRDKMGHKGTKPKQ